VLEKDIIPLNRIEHGYVALEGLAGSALVSTCFRLSGPVDLAQVRRALRQLVTACPKMRSLVEPGKHLYHLRVMPDGPLMEQWVDQALVVDHGIDLEDIHQLEAWQRAGLNDQLPLEHGPLFMLRVVLDPKSPGFVFATPHLIGDGLTSAYMTHLLIRGLNGMSLEAMPIEAPSLIDAIKPEKWWQWPVQMWKSRQHKVSEKRRMAELDILQLPTQATSHYTSTGYRLSEVSMGADQMRKAAKKAGVSMNCMMVAACAQTFLDQALGNPKAAAVIRISIDMRRFYPKEDKHGPLWGNHVGAYLVIEQDVGKSTLDRLQSIDTQLKEGIARYSRREMCWSYLFDEIGPYLGRTLIGYIALHLKRKDRFPKISMHVTNGGNLNMINVPGQPLSIVWGCSTTFSASPLCATMEISGHYYAPITWQLAETSEAQVAEYHLRLDASLRRMVADIVGEAPVAMMARAA
jgi:hypothetical protein